MPLLTEKEKDEIRKYYSEFGDKRLISETEQACEEKIIDKVSKKLKVDIICGKCISQAEKQAKAEERKRILKRLENMFDYECDAQMASTRHSFLYAKYLLNSCAYKELKAELEKGD